MYNEADVILVCFSIDMDKGIPETLEDVASKIEEIVYEIQDYCPNVPYLLVATMKDLRDDPKFGNLVTPEEGKKIAKKIGAYGYLECSAITREGVVEVFTMAARICLATQKNKVSVG